MTAAFLVVTFLLFTAPAFAWEFSMKGEFEYRFRYFGRLGDRDLFGIVSAGEQAGIPVGFAGPNIYGSGAASPFLADMATGQLVITRGGYSRLGSDAYYNDLRLTLYPEIRVNKAIRVFGVYNIGGTRNKYWQGLDYDAASVVLGTSPGIPPFERYYMSQTSMNGYDTGAIGSWEQVRATIQLPIGVLSVGLKDFPFGIGATFGENTRSESLLFVAPYGPLRFLYAIWLGRNRFIESWGSNPDGALKNTFFQAGLFTYESGHLGLGGASIWRAYHSPTRLGANVSAALADAFHGNTDDVTWANLVYVKYNNGVFFANGEFAWVNIEQYPTINIGEVDVTGLPRTEAHIEACHWFAEAGVLIGPAKFTFMSALASGPVLNNNNRTKIYRAWPINYQAMEPYELLMFNTYAGGNNGGWAAADITFVSDEHGMMSDAYCLAGRIDYAVAANLNVWSSFIWANRVEKNGYLIGQFNQTGAASAAGNGPGSFAAAQGFPNRNPYVDDGFIGWELGAGVGWKLLEGFTLNTRYALWQPGQWFDWAYRAVTPVPVGVVAGDAVMTNRDLIQAIQGTMMIDF
ncbi:MAG: hypothetical protein FJ118_00680 [Deltaproteobacteria bacterium]|nr:hypothetical protein [Deltaproteobacteria bacterium]